MEHFVSSPLSEDDPRSEPPRPPSRRRRDRGLLAPLTESGRGEVLAEVAHNALPGVDFFLFLALAALFLVAGFFFNHPTIIVAAALVAPVMTPVLGLSLAATTGSARFFLRVLAGFLVGTLIVIALSALAGWIGQTQFDLDPFTSQSLGRTRLNVVDFALALAGGAFTALALARSPQAAAVPGVALAYELLPPLGVVGLGLLSRQPHIWQGGLMVFGVHLSAAVLAGVVIFLILGFQPVLLGRLLFGLDLAWVITGLLVILIVVGNLWAVQTRTTRPEAVTLILVTPSSTPTRITPPATGAFTSTPVTPSATPLLPTAPATAIPVPTATLTATHTATPIPPTATATPTPTPALARITSPDGRGAIVRDGPDGSIIASLSDNAIIQILAGPTEAAGYRWVKIRDSFGQEGWLADILFSTVTPQPSATP